MRVIINDKPSEFVTVHVPVKFLLVCWYVFINNIYTVATAVLYTA